MKNINLDIDVNLIFLSSFVLLKQANKKEMQGLLSISNDGYQM